MDFLKKAGLDGQVEKTIDQVADVAKDKVNTLMGGGQKKENKQSGAGGIGNLVGDTINKAAADVAADKAADKVMSIGKNLLG